jgi:hypothetical protein
VAMWERTQRTLCAFVSDCGFENCLAAADGLYVATDHD